MEKNIWQVTKIDWSLAQEFFGTNEPSPENFVHELAHSFDIFGCKAFNTKIGTQAELAKRIHSNYETVLDADLAEMKVSAGTFLVLQPLGFLDINEIIHSMCGNLSMDWYLQYGKLNHQDTRSKGRKVAENEFMKYIRDSNSVAHRASISIRDVLVSNFELK